MLNTFAEAVLSGWYTGVLIAWTLALLGAQRAVKRMQAQANETHEKAMQAYKDAGTKHEQVTAMYQEMSHGD
jgi:hypothetical protein